MQALMMDYQLNVPAILRRGEELYGQREIVSRLPDKSWHRYTYADFTSRARKLAVALRGLGLEDGDRVGTLMWNHHEHLETYIGAPVGGFVTHTLNLRLHPDDNTYIASHAGDRVLVVDKVLWPLAAQFVDRVGFEHVIAVGAGETPDGAIDYEELLASADESQFAYRDIDEREAAAMCFTSGTTGLPKGVVYSHRAIAIHALTAAWLLGINEGDTVLPVVPMFHANAWCFPFTCTLVGAKQVFPGPHLDPQSLLDAFVEEQVTVSAGVPTIWMGILQTLDANPTGWDLSRIRTMTVGGAAPPRAMIEAFGERHGLHITHGWGMTEMCPIGTISGGVGQELGLEGAAVYDKRAQQGPPIPFVEIRARGEQGLVPWDGESMGELEVRGPSISSAYFESPDSGDRWTDDGWFRTGDIVTIGSRRVCRDPGSRQGPRQVRRRVDLDGRARERADGTPSDRRGGGDRGARREVVGAPARGVRAARGRRGDRRRAPRVPRAELRQVLASRPLRVRRGDPEDRGRQVPQDRPSRAVRVTRRSGEPVARWEPSSRRSGTRRSRSSRSTTRR